MILDHLLDHNVIFYCAESLESVNKFKEAQEYFMKAYEMRKRLYKDEDHFEIASSLNSLAISYGNFGDYNKSTEFNLKAYAMLDRIYKDEDHIYKVELLKSLAISYDGLCDF